MDKEEYRRARKSAAEEQKQFLQDNPKVRRLVMTKRVFIWFLTGYLAVHFFLSIGILMIQDNLTVGMAGIELAKLFFQVLWICLFLNPAGVWKLNIMLYVSAAYNFFMLLENREIMQSVWIYLPHMDLVSGLLYRCLMLTEAVFPFILLAMALWLTLPRKNRELAEEASAMYQETLQELRNRFK